MTADRWRQIERIYQEAAALPRDQRAALLDRACTGDLDLRSEVERMLSGDAELGSFLETPAVQIVARDLTVTHVTPGTRLGPYEIESLLGAGGMGEVYKARDTRLNRTVAIKVLPHDTAADASLRRRLLREAQTASALNHTHIVTIHDVLSDGDRDCIVMEYLDGRTLKDAIGGKGLPLAECLRYGIEIAGGLAAAHAAGIVHRDLKPGNVMLTKSGVKILDFGLAKSAADETLTASRLVMGTPAYMAPEQLAGKVADQRSDIYALGLMLGEMATGTRDREKGLNETNRPPQFVHIVRRCLEKDPEDRWQSARDLTGELEWSLHELKAPAPTGGGAGSNWKRTAAISAVALALGAIAAGLAIYQFRSAAERREPMHLQINPPAKGEFVSGESGGVAISPDGRILAFIARVDGKTGLWIQSLSEGVARLLPGTAGASEPFWSPNSKSIAFFARENLLRIDLAGGTPATICYAASPRGGTWLPDGRILFTVAPAAVSQVPASGGTPSPLTKLDTASGEFGHFWPEKLPAGGFLYSSRTNNLQKRGVYAAKLDQPNIRVFLADTDSAAIYAPGHDGKGYLFWAREQTLMAQEFDAEALKLIGEARPVYDPIGLGLYGEIQATASLNGLLVAGGPSGNLNQLTWIDRSGNSVAQVGEPANPRDFVLSDDGQQVVVSRGTPGGFDLWVLDVKRNTSRRLVFDPGTNVDPLWSPDGRTVVFTHVPDLFRVDANGGVTARINESPVLRHATSWSRDGLHILFYSVGKGTKRDLLTLSVSPTGVIDPEPRPYLHSIFNEVNGSFSPEMNPKWVVYESDESGRYEIYIQSFPNPGRSVQVSREGGRWAKWGASTRELFYASGRQLMAVELKPEKDSLEPVVSHPLFTLPERDQRFAVSPDGQRFLVNVPAKASPTPTPLSVLVNWSAGAQ